MKDFILPLSPDLIFTGGAVSGFRGGASAASEPPRGADALEKKDGAAEKGAVRWEGSEFDYRLRVGRHRFGYRVDKGGSKIFVDDA